MEIYIAAEGPSAYTFIFYTYSRAPALLLLLLCAPAILLIPACYARIKILYRAIPTFYSPLREEYIYIKGQSKGRLCGYGEGAPAVWGPSVVPQPSTELLDSDPAAAAPLFQRFLNLNIFLVIIIRWRQSKLRDGYEVTAGEPRDFSCFLTHGSPIHHIALRCSPACLINGILVRTMVLLRERLAQS